MMKKRVKKMEGNMNKYQKLTLIHSNDIHGDFFEEENQGKVTGGLAMLSGYVQQVRREEEQVIYAIAGDMLQGSIIDNEYRGISTIDIMNMLNPDIVTLGNHEIDYGITHLLFLERCAKFPIINANLHINATDTRLFQSHHIIERNGMRMLFIGIITNDVLSLCPYDPLITSFISVMEAAREIERICNSYRNVDVDFTVILTHIGIEEDIKLAESINPHLGVDLIIGGHSHTMMEEPLRVNDILIAHAGHGSDQVGRFDIIVDMENNCVHQYEWRCVPIDNTTVKDTEMELILGEYKTKVDDKYSTVLTRLKRPLFHPGREQETELGNLFADILVESYGLDLFMLGSGSIRKEKLEEIVTKGRLKELFPYDDEVYCMWLTGEELRGFVRAAVERFYGGQTREFYQYSKGFKMIYNDKQQRVDKVLLGETEPDGAKIYTLGLQGYHFDNAKGITGIDLNQSYTNRPPKILSTSVYDPIEEYFSTHNNIISEIQGRIVRL